MFSEFFKGKKRLVEDDPWATLHPRYKRSRTDRLNTVAHRIRQLNENEARNSENGTLDPRQEMDPTNPTLYCPCERDPPWQWPRVRPDYTYLRNEWTENPDFHRYFDDVYLSQAKCRTYHSALCLTMS